jgi:hypothetical protein
MNDVQAATPDPYEGTSQIQRVILARELFRT